MEYQQASYRLPRAHGPRVAVIGGGHGLANMLRGLKQYTENLAAVVTVADDGGGSGMLRQDPGHAASRRYPQLYGGSGQHGAGDAPAAQLPLYGGFPGGAELRQPLSGGP